MVIRKDTLSCVISWSEVCNFKWFFFNYSYFVLWYYKSRSSVICSAAWHLLHFACRGLDLYSTVNGIACLTSYDQRRSTSSLSSQRVTCVTYGLCMCFSITNTAICVGLRNPFPCIVMHGHSVHHVMVTGRMLNKWSMGFSASSWIQIFTNGFPECNLSKWTVIIILDLPHP